MQFKVALLMFLVHNRLCPDYLSDTVLQISDDPGRQRLRKGDGTDYDEPCTYNNEDGRSGLLSRWSEDVERSPGVNTRDYIGYSLRLI